MLISPAFTNLTSVEEQVISLRNRTNLIGWYTGDEPDGNHDLNSTSLAYDLIRSIDPYHSVSLTLNCENYYYIQYGIEGGDIIRVDPYPVNVAAAFSRQYLTVCTTQFGCCGCDNCNGSMYDVSTRVDSAIDRTRLLGLGREKTIWGVQQSFDDYGTEFWNAAPTGNDIALQLVVGLNHGAMGLTPFDSPGATLEYIQVSLQDQIKKLTCRTLR
jgi:hypothetical protein